MPHPIGQPQPARADEAIEALRLPPSLHVAAASRLVSDQAGSRAVAARRFVRSAANIGIDLSLLWGTLDASRTRVNQVCLAVIGSGATAMLFVSAGIDDKSGKRRTDPAPAERAQALAERTAVIHEACRFLAAEAQALPQAAGRPVRLAQALIEHRENDAGEAFAAAGFLRLGDLAYLRRPIAGSVADSGARAGPLPPGVRAIRVDSLEPSKAADLLLAALERTYIDTLDCPELCGVRRVGDVLESHRSVGEHDPSLWWVVIEADRPEGCMLFNPNPAQDAVELVYLGLSPRLRGRGIGSALLGLGLASLADVPLSSVCCAVDTRNTPALRLYAGAGFERADTRIPFVKPLGPDAP